MVDYPFSEKEEQFLECLVDNGVPFMLVGLSAAAIQGAPVVTQDVDLWFSQLGDPRLHRALNQAGVTYIPSEGDHPPMFVGGGAALFDIVTHVHGIGAFEAELVHTIPLVIRSRELRILRLDRIIASKKFLGRPKDLLVLPVLEDVWAALQADAG